MRPNSIRTILGFAPKAAKQTPKIAIDPKTVRPFVQLPIDPKAARVSVPGAKSLSPKADFQKPNPEEFDAPLERTVRNVEFAEDMVSNVQGATALGMAVARRVGSSVPAIVSNTNAVLQKANPVATMAMALGDSARVASSPKYREALEKDAERILTRRATSKTKQLGQDIVEGSGYIGRPMSAIKVLQSVANQKDTERVNAELKAQSAQRQAREMQRKYEEQRFQTPRVSSLAGEPSTYSRDYSPRTKRTRG